MKEVICDKCDYEWNTSSKMMYVSCPNCMSKVKIKKEGVTLNEPKYEQPGYE